MRTNAAGLELIKNAEGLRLEAYVCPAGVLTIGYGHTEGVKKGDRITAHQAEVMLQSDLENVYEPAVARQTAGVPLNENQFSALVSFFYNFGEAKAGGSTLVAYVRRGMLAHAAAEFMKWKLAAGHVLPGLVKRRAAERELFLR